MNLETLIQKTAQTFLFLGLSWVITACGKQVPTNVVGQSENASRLPVVTNTPNPPKDIAFCNKKTSNDLTAQLSVYYDRTKTYHPEFVRVWIPEMDESYSDSAYQFVFRKWKASLQGETYQEATPLKVRVERINDKEPVSTYMDTLHWNTAAAEIKKYTNSNLEMKDALKLYSFVIDLKDPTASFDVLKMSLYKDGNHIKDWNILIPAFYAHPLTYANSQNPVLATLHPFAGAESSSFGGEHFASVLNGYCF